MKNDLNYKYDREKKTSLVNLGKINMDLGKQFSGHFISWFGLCSVVVSVKDLL